MDKERVLAIFDEIITTLDRINVLQAEIDEFKQDKELVNILNEREILLPITESAKEFSVMPLPVKPGKRPRRQSRLSN